MAKHSVLMHPQAIRPEERVFICLFSLLYDTVLCTNKMET